MLADKAPEQPFSKEPPNLKINTSVNKIQIFLPLGLQPPNYYRQQLTLKIVCAFQKYASLNIGSLLKAIANLHSL